MVLRVLKLGGLLLKDRWVWRVLPALFRYEWKLWEDLWEFNLLLKLRHLFPAQDNNKQPCSHHMYHTHLNTGHITHQYKMNVKRHCNLKVVKTYLWVAKNKNILKCKHEPWTFLLVVRLFFVKVQMYSLTIMVVSIFFFINIRSFTNIIKKLDYALNFNSDMFSKVF